MARPRKELREARGETLGIRLTDAERAAIESRAASAGLTVSDFARRVMVNSRLAVNTVRRADPTLVLAINRLGVNLNQIARAFNAEGGRFAGYQHSDLTETLARINTLLDHLQEQE